jgi:hypothetical protein
MHSSDPALWSDAPTCGKEWELMSKSARPLFWSTPTSNGVRFRVAQLIFETNADAMAYVKKHLPHCLAEALSAWGVEAKIPETVEVK